MSTAEFMTSNVDMLIHSEARIEGAECSFADTQAILATGNADGATDEDIRIVLALKRAWGYLLGHVDEEITFDLFAKYNFLVQQNYKPRGGEIRTEEISISDCGYVPSVYDENDFYNVLGTAMDGYSSDVDRALALLFMLCKHQFFWDGNKRSAQLLVNHYLAHIDARMYLLVPDGEEETFLGDLVAFYEGRISLDDVTWLEGYLWRI